MTRPAGTPAGSAAGSRPGASRPAAGPAAAAPTPAGPAEPAPTAAEQTGRRRAAPWWLVALLGVLALAGLVATLLLLTRPSQDELRDSALRAARQYTQSLTTYDARTLDEDVDRVQGVSAPEFASEYERTISELREQITADSTVSVGTVVAAGVERVEDDSAVVLVAVDQAVTAAGQPTRTEANRVRMALVRRDGRWLVQDVERL